MTDSIFDDFDSFVEPFLNRSKPGAVRARGRPTAEEIARLAPSPRETKLNQSADNATVPPIYGETPVTGQIFGVVEDSGFHHFLVMWGFGPIHSIKTLFINGSSDLSGVTSLSFRHYHGTAFQEIDPWFESFVAGYEDDLILLRPEGKAGVAYTSIRLATSWVNTNGIPAFQAIVKGSFCYDPDKASYTDSYFDDVGAQVRFIGTDGSAPTDLDESLNERPLVYLGGATIQSNALPLNGTNQGVRLDNHVSLRFGTEPWSITMVFTTDVVTATQRIIFNYGNFLLSRTGLTISRTDDDLKVQLSSDGVNADIMDATILSVFTVDVDVTLTVEFTGQSYLVLIGGQVVAESVTSDVVFPNTTDPLTFGSGANLLWWDGKIKSFQLTFGSYRFGSGVADPGSPWLDSGKFKTGYVYTDNTALCLAEFISNPFYGEGVPLSAIRGIQEGKDWNDELLGGAVPRSRLSLALTTVATSSKWRDQLSVYAGVFTITEEDGIAIIPDRPPSKDNPSGRQHVRFHTMQVDPSDYWTFDGAEWSYDSGNKILVLSGAQAGTTNATYTLTDLIVGEKYAIRLGVVWISEGDDYSISIDATEVLSGQSGEVASVEYLVGQFTATATSHVLKLTGDADLSMWINPVSVRGFRWIETEIEQDSLSIRGVSDIETPTKVNVSWRQKQDTTPNWPEKSAPYTIPDAELGNIALIETNVPLPGIYRAEEAVNKATARALRLKARNEYRWTSLDTGVALRVGTVTRLWISEIGLDQEVMVMSARMNKYGRYDVVGETFDASHYPDALELPENTGVVPIGAIGIQAAAQTPADYQAYTDANGKFLIGADFDEIGDTEGTATYAGWSGTTSVGGGHTSSAASSPNSSPPGIPIRDRTNPAGSSGTQTRGTSTLHGEHQHIYSTGLITPNPYRLDSLLIERINTPGVTVPKEVMVFGDPSIMLAGLSRSTVWAGRVIKANTATAPLGPAQQFINFTTASGSIASHGHKFPFLANTLIDFPNVVGVYEASDIIDADHDHTHTVTLELIRNLRRIGLALYIGSENFSVVPGIMFFWAGTQSELSAYPDWTLCTGRLGTRNVIDRYFEIAGLGSEDVLSGDNTISISGNVNFDEGHTHLEEDAETTTAEGAVLVGHELWAHKDHAISHSAAHQPLSQKIGLIVYNPNPEWGYVDLALLLGGGGTHGSSTIIDSGPNNLSPTTVDEVTYSNVNTFFSTTSLRCNSPARDGVLQYDGILGGLLNGRYTLGMWFRTSTIVGLQFLANSGKDNGGKDYWEWRIDENGDMELRYSGGSVVIQGSGEVAINTNYFGALCWDGEELRVYCGEVSTGTASLVGSFAPSPAPDWNDNLAFFNNVGRSGSFTGWAEDIYLIDGAAQFSGSVIEIPDQPPRS